MALISAIPSLTQKQLLEEWLSGSWVRGLRWNEGSGQGKGPRKDCAHREDCSFLSLICQGMVWWVPQPCPVIHHSPGHFLLTPWQGHPCRPHARGRDQGLPFPSHLLSKPRAQPQGSCCSEKARQGRSWHGGPSGCSSILLGPAASMEAKGVRG